MGKKSRLKKLRREAKLRAKASSSGSKKGGWYTSGSQGLLNIFSQYSAKEVFESLCISDLWVPNISSQMRHGWTFAIACSMELKDFEASKKIDTFADFQQFLIETYQHLCELPMLEDYVPEPDWKDVTYGNQAKKFIFYGSSIERLPDFVTAFNLANSQNHQALRDMHTVLDAQHLIQSHIPSEVSGKKESIELGTLEAPSEEFWTQCRDTLTTLSKHLSEADIRPELMFELGQYSAPQNTTEFSEFAMTGKLTPRPFIDTKVGIYPVSLRNAPASVMGLWNNSEVKPGAILNFLALRYKNLTPGPLAVRTRTEVSKHPITAVLTSRKIFLFLVIDEQDISQLDAIEKEIEQIILNGDWGFYEILKERSFKVESAGSEPQVEDIRFITIIPSFSLTPRFIRLPQNAKSHVFFLSDFITIFDSITDSDELGRFIAFLEDKSIPSSPMAGICDQFGAFVDSKAVLLDGATAPNMISLDPHWGSNWRFKHFKDHRLNNPSALPSWPSTRWKSNLHGDGVYEILARNCNVAGYSAEVEDCNIHFLWNIDFEINSEKLKVLQVTMQALADSIGTRKEVLAQSELFSQAEIITLLNPEFENFSADGVESPNEIFSIEDIELDEHRTRVRASIQLDASEKCFRDAQDASGEVEILTQWINCIYQIRGIQQEEELIDQLRATAKKPPRFTISQVEHEVDTPDMATPKLPTETQFKLARKKLAEIFHDQDVEPGIYELDTAKEIINSARSAFRDHIHQEILSLNKEGVLKFCVEQIDAVSADFKRKEAQIQLSLKHEVGYERNTKLAEYHDNFVRNSKNLRYLLECKLSQETSEEQSFSDLEVNDIVAKIDWLLTLYNASDILHYEVEVGGINLDSMFVPEVFYSDSMSERQNKYAKELADIRLGVGLNDSDGINPIDPDHEEWKELNLSFEEDIGISLEDILVGIHGLYRLVRPRVYRHFPALKNTVDRLRLAQRDHCKYAAV